MGRVFLFGITCAVFAFLVIMAGQFLNLNLQNVLFGTAAGAILALVRIQSPVARLGAYMIGVIFGMALFLLRAGVLPSTWIGNALAVVIIILILTAVSAFTKDRLPLWAMLLGAMTFVGAYNGYFTSTPWLYKTQIISTASGTLLPFAAGFLVVLFVELRVERGGVDLIDPMEPLPPPTDDAQALDEPTPSIPAPSEPSPADSSDEGLALLNGPRNEGQ